MLEFQRAFKRKTIEKTINHKINNWMKTLEKRDDANVLLNRDFIDTIRDNIIVTGGCRMTVDFSETHKRTWSIEGDEVCFSCHLCNDELKNVACGDKEGLQAYKEQEQKRFREVLDNATLSVYLNGTFEWAHHDKRFLKEKFHNRLKDLMKDRYKKATGVDWDE